MTKTEYADKIKEELKNYLPDDWKEADIRIISKVKPNDTVQIGLAFPCERDDSLISMYVYIDDLYEKAINKGIYEPDPSDLINIAELITKTCNDQTYNQLSTVSIKAQDYKQFREHLQIIVRLKEMNEKYLGNIVCKESYCGLVQYCAISYGNISIDITNEMLDVWKVNKETLFSDARNCMKQKEYALYRPDKEKMHLLSLPGDVPPFKSFMKNVWEEQDFTPDPDQFFYLFTCDEPGCGSYTLADMDILGRIRQTLGVDFWIIPSTIHEIICLAQNNYGNINEELRSVQGLIHEINNCKIMIPEDVLSDKLFHFSKHGLETADDYINRISGS